MESDNSTTELKQGEGFYSPSESMIVSLQSILQNKSCISVSFDEAQEIGIQLVSLYECLARDRGPVLEAGEDEHRK